MHEMAQQQGPIKSGAKQIKASALKPGQGSRNPGRFVVKIKTSELDELALDWVVAQIEREKVCLVVVDGKPQIWFSDYVYDNFKSQAAYCDKSGKARFLRDGKPVGLFGCPMTSYLDWGVGGPLCEREGIAVRKHGSGTWYAMMSADLGDTEGARWSLHTFKDVPRTASTSRQCRFEGPTQLIAAMRCYVASKHGDEVDVPEELL